jgi:hypothetical protein
MVNKELQAQADISGAINVMGFKFDDFVKYMSMDDKSIQADFTLLCIRWLEYMADDPYDKVVNDERTLYSHLTASVMVRALRELELEVIK